MLLRILYPLRLHRRSSRWKMLPLTGMIFCILFNYTLIYSLRDSLIFPILGAEIYSFLEFWVVLPSAFIVTVLYIKLSSVIQNKERIFYIFMFSFLAFYLFFAFYLYPNHDLITPDKTKVAEWMQAFPHAKWFILIVCEWPYTLFNVFIELWINVVLSLLFWQLANQVTTTTEAKALYPIVLVAGQSALIFAGTLLKYYANNSLLEDLVPKVVLTVVALGLIITYLHHYIYAHLRRQARDNPKLKPDPAATLSFRASLRMLLRSRYLWMMAMVVISYGLTINISQAVWKSQAARYFTTTLDYITYMGTYKQMVGITSMVTMVIGGIMLRYLRWFICALTPAILIGLSGLLFFTWVTFMEPLQPYFNNILYATIMVGMAEVTLSKSLKYSIFDATKEMAYIPLSRDLKSKGKSAVDVFGERFGKASGAFIQTAMFSIFPAATYCDLSPYLMVIFIAGITAWIYALRKLNTEYIEITKLQ
jgi:AAA family ATP:ADP antiporter